MRLATFGLDLPTQAATRLGFRDRGALEPFDAVLIDPDAVLAEYAGEIEQHGPDPVLSVRGSEALLADLRRRRADMLALLARGGAVAFHPPGPRGLRAHTLEALIDVLPAMVLPIDGIETQAGSGAAPASRGGEPFATFHAALADDLVAREVLIDPPGEKLFPDASGRPAGFYLAHNRGHVLALPRARSADRLAAALTTLLARLAIAADDAVPAWTRHHLLPGEDALRARLDRIDADRRRLDAQRAEARAALDPFERRKLLLTGRGRALYDAASLAFWDLGGTVYQGPFGETDLVLEWHAQTALVDTIGRAGPIVEDDVLQLADWSATMSRRLGEPVKAVLLAVSHRDLPLAERPQPAFASEVETAARSRGVALVLGPDLLAASAAAWQGRAAADPVLAAIFAATGRTALAPG